VTRVTLRLRAYRALCELPLMVLCLWAAYFHTPAGALVRDVGARVFGTRSSARPLLSYYSGALETSEPSQPSATLRPVRAVSGPVALAYGLRAHLKSHPADQVAVLRALAARGKITPDDLPAIGEELARRTHAFGSEDAAVLSLFEDEYALRFALDRARGGGAPQTLESIARFLPPGGEDAVTSAADVLALGTAYGLSWPLASTQVSSGFGMREHPILGEEKMHTGIDLPVPRDTPVHSAGEGVVRRASEDAVNGRVLVIDHGHGVTTAYCHNDRLLVSEAAPVTRGERVALSGDTGRATGPHLHYQLEIFGHPVDPLAFRPAAELPQARDEAP
jgi:murein DD-endopeptidase